MEKMKLGDETQIKSKIKSAYEITAKKLGLKSLKYKQHQKHHKKIWSTFNRSQVGKWLSKYQYKQKN